MPTAISHIPLEQQDSNTIPRIRLLYNAIDTNLYTPTSPKSSKLHYHLRTQLLPNIHQFLSILLLASSIAGHSKVQVYDSIRNNFICRITLYKVHVAVMESFVGQDSCHKISKVGTIASCKDYVCSFPV